MNNLVIVVIGNIQQFSGYRWFKFGTEDINISKSFDVGRRPFDGEEVGVCIEVFYAGVSDDIFNVLGDGVGVNDVLLAED